MRVVLLLDSVDVADAVIFTADSASSCLSFSQPRPLFRFSSFALSARASTSASLSMHRAII